LVEQPRNLNIGCGGVFHPAWINIVTTARREAVGAERRSARCMPLEELVEKGATEKGSTYVDASSSVEVVSLEQYEQGPAGQYLRLVAFKVSHR
jgi:hypothetical protein